MQRFVQLALDLFGDPPREPPPELQRAAAPAPPALPMAEVFQPGTWHHPRANRLVRLRGCEVGYEFQRGKRRTIGLSVGAEGLSVRAPRWSTFGEIEAVLHEKAAWVIDKLVEARERAERQARSRVRWADGAELPLLGEPVRLQLDPAHGFSGRGAALDAVTRTLRIGLPHHASESQIRDAAQAWLMRHARSVFTERLDHFAPQLGVRWTRLSLSNADTRWGSASADGRIRLNWRLVHLSMEMVDYVVVHELSHLRHMDHSPRFWDVVASVMPDHAERRRALKESALPLGEG
ncbi:M48 family metallopeptidase [Hydrogenophaga intermedia]|uniref:M48 family metallopeptidase n=1 Tax=Hydrogenophaga intermedia TaxID=65786 RepID=UPI002044CA31|nr:SprT family zinc-dependent metalloprotease [Hydrogenophaga intermedia]MCM3564610.1 M48 family metallopeptidase [Hydrogenophaga intermedia]